MEPTKPADKATRDDVQRRILKMFEADKAPGFMELHARALEQVQSSPLWRRFIDGTPLANDIAVWMANFALEAVEESGAYATPAKGESKNG